MTAFNARLGAKPRVTTGAGSCQRETRRRLCRAHDTAEAYCFRVICGLPSTRAHLLVVTPHKLCTHHFTHHCAARFDSGCIVAVGVIKTTLHAARDILPASRA